MTIKLRSSLLSKSGLSLVETMISVGILTVLIAGSMGAFSTFQKYIVMSRAKTTLINMRNGVLERLRNDKTWDRSLTLSTNTQCLQNGADCNGAAFGLSLCMETATDATIATECMSNGDVYSIEGVPDCVGDTMQCPFTVLLVMPNACAAANCHPTSVAVQYNVTVSAEFMAAIGAIDNDNNNLITIYGGKYGLIYNRNLGTLGEAFSAIEVIGNVNSGACTAASWVQRPLNQFLNNPDTNAALSAGDLQLAAGHYKCDVSVPAYAVNSFRIRVRDTVSGWISSHGTGYAQRTAANAGAQSTATVAFDTTFAAAANLKIEFIAETCNGGETNAFGMKIPGVGGAYNNTQLSIITCTRVF